MIDRLLDTLAKAIAYALPRRVVQAVIMRRAIECDPEQADQIVADLLAAEAARRADADALRGDWNRVGRDMQKWGAP